MTDLIKVIQFLKQQRTRIVFEGEDDEGAAEYYGHMTDVIEDLEDGKMTIEEAGASLGINLK
jgi:hypothetical protein